MTLINNYNDNNNNKIMKDLFANITKLLQGPNAKVTKLN